MRCDICKKEVSTEKFTIFRQNHKKGGPNPYVGTVDLCHNCYRTKMDAVRRRNSIVRFDR